MQCRIHIEKRITIHYIFTKIYACWSDKQTAQSMNSVLLVEFLKSGERLNINILGYTQCIFGEVTH